MTTTLPAPEDLLLGPGRTLADSGLPGLTVTDLYDAGGAEFYDAFVGTSSADIASLVSVAVAGRGPVADLACGSGRLTMPLAQRRLPVLAVDISGPMLARLDDRLRAADATVAGRVHTVRTDMIDMDLGRNFTTVLLAATSIVLVPADRRTAFFRTVRRHLAPGGRFAFDYHVHDEAALRAQPERLSVFALHDPAGLVVCAQHFDLQARHETVNFYVERVCARTGTTRALYTTRKQIFFRPEIEADLSAAGLRIISRAHPQGPASTQMLVCEAAA